MFRKSTIHDLQGVYELICQLVRRELDRDMFARVYAEQMENDDCYCLVAEKDGKLYAVLNLRFDRQLHHCGNCAEIVEFFVREDARSQGTGAQMVRLAEEEAVKRQCVLIEVTSNKARVHAHRFYMREGMEQTHAKFVREF